VHVEFSDEMPDLGESCALLDLQLEASWDITGDLKEL